MCCVVEIKFVLLTTLAIVSRQSRENCIESTFELSIVSLFFGGAALDSPLFFAGEVVVPKLLFVCNFSKFAALLPGGRLISDIHLIAECLDGEGVVLIGSLPIECLVVLDGAPYLLEGFAIHLDVEHVSANCNNYGFGLADRERVSEIAKRSIALIRDFGWDLLFDLVDFRAIAEELLLARELAREQFDVVLLIVEHHTPNELLLRPESIDVQR